MTNITVRLRAILDELRREADCEIYVVVVVSEGEVCALLVPHGAEGKPCSNPLGLENNAEDYPPPGAGDWARIDRPLMMTVDERVPLLKARPKLAAAEQPPA